MMIGGESLASEGSGGREGGREGRGGEEGEEKILLSKTDKSDLLDDVFKQIFSKWRNREQSCQTSTTIFL